MYFSYLRRAYTQATHVRLPNRTPSLFGQSKTGLKGVLRIKVINANFHGSFHMRAHHSLEGLWQGVVIIARLSAGACLSTKRQGGVKRH